MIYILDPDGHVYIDGVTLSSDALARACAKYDPRRCVQARRGNRRNILGNIWDEMKAKGFSILDKPQP